MKVKEAVKIVDEDWIRKPKGFRVHFQKMVDSELLTEYVPGDEEKPLDSDVVAWRLAWKLSEATKSDTPEIKEGDIVNITVVDDLGHPVKFYGTNQPQILNAKDVGHA